ncbi:MAG: TIGR00296 family protein [Methanobacteriales archaeon HGW-Methanobacteriales-1]|jgi:hypothetical protein|nr:MAG: TIGR00296 family protein [Methanobacteriales archaeon HGW-Methanobacteriales-1]
MLSEDEGEFLLKLARKSINSYIKDKKIISPPQETPESLKETMGAFVTLNKKGTDRGKGELRGCIGYCEPIKPLVNAVIEVAISAASSDPRFPPVKESEMSEIGLEISVLSKPKLVEVENPKDYLKKIKVGLDGLIVEKNFYKGLLLPQVPVEWNWDEKEFLCNTCMKAGLPSDCWYDADTKIFNFQAQIFHEKE